MKILYATLGAGNGHVSRARDIIPHLVKYGEVDIALSGTDAQVDLPCASAFQQHGLIFHLGKRGGLDYWKTVKELRIPELIHDIATFPIRDYDVIINDFEPITAYAALRANVRATSLSHQASFLSEKTPRPPRRDFAAEQILVRYAPCPDKIGLHFEAYDSFIRTPVIRHEVRTLKATEEGHYTVYLPAYEDEYLIEYLGQITDTRWEIFSKRAKAEYVQGSFRVRPISSDPYMTSLAGCSGLLTGGGFEAPAEALFLGKKVLMVPQKGQYEQLCNAEAARRLGVPVVLTIDKVSLPVLAKWVHETKAFQVDYPDHTEEIVEKIMQKQRTFFPVHYRKSKDTVFSSNRRR